MIEFKTLSTDLIEDVIKLQYKNLRVNLSKYQQEEQGFLTISHSKDLLEGMTSVTPSIIAVEDNTIAGYCLSMDSQFRNSVPILVPMFDLFDSIEIDGIPLKDLKYITVGQVCVAEEFRGRGTFSGLYNSFKKCFSEEYNLAITEISDKNKRSMAAHKKVGFEFLKKYTAPDGEIWNVVV